MYTLILSDRAKEDIVKLKRNDPNSLLNSTFKKISKLLIELTQHPREGTGQIEVLKHFDEEESARNTAWSIVYMTRLWKCLFCLLMVITMINN